MRRSVLALSMALGRATNRLTPRASCRCAAGCANAPCELVCPVYASHRRARRVRAAVRSGPRLLSVLALVAAAASAGAEESALDVSWARDGALAAGALGLWGGAELEKGALAPPACRLCGTPPLDADARRALRWSSTRTAASLSDAAMISVPVAVAAYDVLSARGAAAAGDDLLVMTEALALTGLVTQAAKYGAARTRPYAYGGSDRSRDDHLSFWSGHTSAAFAAAASGGMVAQLRGYRGWPWIYGAGLAAAAATGYLRVAADRHWLTDVAAAAVAGTAVGLAVPWLHRGGAARSVRLSPAPGGIAVVGDL